jgi:4-alpha-glucanotransferase
MADSTLIRRAEAAGITPVYPDWRGQQVEVSSETLTAILDALASVPAASAEADHRSIAPDGSGAVAPPAPGSRSWGFAVQLYALRSRHSWGHGDLHDLADLARWSARDLGAAFVLINPLHAAEPLPPVSSSPYLPMTRRYVSPLYLRVEDIAEYQRLSARQRQRIDALAAPLRSRNGAADLINRDAVWAAKREALQIIRSVPMSGQRRSEYQRFRRREGRHLADWVAWCARAERYGPDWRSWPAGHRDPRAGGFPLPGELPGADPEPEFHAWLQWLADEQLAAAQRSAQGAGMDIGIIGDLAVGAHPGGADAWAHQDLLVRGLSVGAPPDEFNQRGQDWSQPPWHPGRLAAVGYRPMADLFAAAMRHSGGLRVDHVMGLIRLWCVPAGMPPERGAYIRYDHRATVAALTGQAAQAGALAIGEDLGTIEPWMSRSLEASGMLGTSMLWFARQPGGAPLPPARWRRNCMATVGTHDMPPAAAFRTGEQVTLRARLGLLKHPENTERASARLMLSQWRDALARERLIPAGPLPGPAGFTVALYGYLARTPAALIGVSLAEAVGDRRPQNIPGTSDEYPNWQIPLCDAEGRPVLLEDLPGLPLVRAVARAAAGAHDPAV